MKKLLLSAVILFLTLTTFAQSVTYSLSPSPSSSPPACPGTAKSYNITASNNSLPSCTYTWTATNGTFVVNNVNNGRTRSGADITAVYGVPHS